MVCLCKVIPKCSLLCGHSVTIEMWGDSPLYGDVGKEKAALFVVPCAVCVCNSHLSVEVGTALLCSEAKVEINFSVVNIRPLSLVWISIRISSPGMKRGGRKWWTECASPQTKHDLFNFSLNSNWSSLNACWKTRWLPAGMPHKQLASYLLPSSCF